MEGPAIVERAWRAGAGDYSETVRVERGKVYSGDYVLGSGHPGVLGSARLFEHSGSVGGRPLRAKRPDPGGLSVKWKLSVYGVEDMAGGEAVAGGKVLREVLEVAAEGLEGKDFAVDLAAGAHSDTAKQNGRQIIPSNAVAEKESQDATGEQRPFLSADQSQQGSGKTEARHVDLQP